MEISTHAFRTPQNGDPNFGCLFGAFFGIPGLVFWGRAGMTLEIV
jgi:hypothetical protein